MHTKEKIYLTDITLHTRNFRQTINFSKAQIKGRMYSPLPKSYNLNTVSPTDNTKGGFRISIKLPPDLQEKLDKGEAELMMPEGGLLIFAGKDLQDKIQQIQDKKRREVIHRSRDKFWRKE